MERELNIVKNSAEISSSSETSSLIGGSIVDSYFTPKGFEKSGKFYERFGIRTFKRYIPTSGDIIMKRRGEKWIEGSDYEKLKLMERYTKVMETIHLAEGLITLVPAAWIALDNNILIASLLTGANIATNLYPIMLQRYNRNRLYRVMDKAQNRHFTIPLPNGN